MKQEPRVVTQRGLYFDELEEGVVYRHTPGRTMTEADNTIFSTLTMNHQALHLDAAWSQENALGGERLMNSMHTVATLIGLSVNQLTQSTIVAQLGFTEITFPKPVYAGDTLYGEVEVVAKREWYFLWALASSGFTPAAPSSWGTLAIVALACTTILVTAMSIPVIPALRRGEHQVVARLVAD